MGKLFQKRMNHTIRGLQVKHSFTNESVGFFVDLVVEFFLLFYCLLLLFLFLNKARTSMQAVPLQ